MLGRNSAASTLDEYLGSLIPSTTDQTAHGLASSAWQLKFAELQHYYYF
jgi:hypothetical protein